MAAQYVAVANQSVSLNSAALLETSIPCRKGYIYHEDGTGIVILRGIVNNPCAGDAQYRVTFGGNVSLPTGSTIAPISMALTLNGEERPASKAIFTPSAVNEIGNVTCSDIVKIPRGCCFTLSVEYVPEAIDPAVTPAPFINLQNANLIIERIA